MEAASLALLGLGLGLPLAWVALRLAPALGLIDAPAPHKVHARPLARSGGLAVLAALGLALALGGPGGALPLAYVLPGLGFFALGVVDDRWRLSAGVKLGAQVLLALLAVGLGLRWQGSGAWGWPDLAFGTLTPLMSVLWIVAVVTVVNFLDGIDLITACTSGVILAAAAGAGLGPGEGALFAAALGALLGCAWWNVTPARIMLGDGGTHLLGFLAATLPLVAPGSGSAAPWPFAGALLLPCVVDVAAGLLSKRLRGVPLAAAHKDHPYQRLVRRGSGQSAVALRYGALGLLALLTAASVPPVWALLVGLVVLGAHLAEAARAPRAPASFFVGGTRDRGEHGVMLKNFGWVRPGKLAGMGRPEADAWPALLETGIRAVLSLTETPPPGDPARHGLAHLHVPIEDFGTPVEADLLRCVTWVREQLAAQRPVAVHCFAGVGRTGTILAAVLVAEGASAAEAIAEVRRARPGSLETSGQVGAVQRLAQRLGRP